MKGRPSIRFFILPLHLKEIDYSYYCNHLNNGSFSQSFGNPIEATSISGYFLSNDKKLSLTSWDELIIEWKYNMIEMITKIRLFETAGLLSQFFISVLGIIGATPNSRFQSLEW